MFHQKETMPILVRKINLSKPLGKQKNRFVYNSKMHRDKPIVVHIKGGNYYVESPVVFTAEDSGNENSPVVYKAADGEEPVFTGSRS